MLLEQYDVNSNMIDENRFPKDILAEADDDAKKANDEPANEFEWLDLKDALCFGYSFPKSNTWTSLA